MVMWYLMNLSYCNVNPVFPKHVNYFLENITLCIYAYFLRYCICEEKDTQIRYVKQYFSWNSSLCPGKPASYQCFKYFHTRGEIIFLKWIQDFPYLLNKMKKKKILSA